MDTKKWGPSMWSSMFIIAVNYPVNIDMKNRLHKAKRKYYKEFFTSFKHILPCKYCRISYAKFLKDIPIKNYLHSRQAITYWVYLIKDKVNKKLLDQESKNKNKNFKTKPSPPFEEICKYYEKYRAYCSDKTQTCSKPSIKIT